MRGAWETRTPFFRPIGDNETWKGRAMFREMSDKEALDILSKWLVDTDPSLTGNLPNWVWSLVDTVEDVLRETGRKTSSEETSV